jgi:hypothetical protein
MKGIRDTILGFLLMVSVVLGIDLLGYGLNWFGNGGTLRAIVGMVIMIPPVIVFLIWLLVASGVIARRPVDSSQTSRTKL